MVLAVCVERASVLDDGLAGGRPWRQVLNLRDLQNGNGHGLLRAVMFGHGDLLIVDRIIGMQSDVATATITSLLLKIGHCDDQFAGDSRYECHR